MRVRISRLLLSRGMSVDNLSGDERHTRLSMPFRRAVITADSVAGSFGFGPALAAFVASASTLYSISIQYYLLEV